MRRFSFALISVLNADHGFVQNKDLNGGLGTTDDRSGAWITNFLNKIKSRYVSLPVVSFAYVQGVLKSLGHSVKFFEGHLPNSQEAFDIILIYGSMVDHARENKIAGQLKKNSSDSRVGFFGPFPVLRPDLFPNADFIIHGEAESFFLNDFKSIEQLSGRVPVSFLTDYDNLPSPDFDGFPIKRYGYAPALSVKPFITLQASKGCPFSCSYYCAYGAVQGSCIRQRSAPKLVEDIRVMVKKYKIRGVLFRDPVFGLKPGFIAEFCRLLIDQKIKILWGMETRLDHLTVEMLDALYAAGLRVINIGVETSDPEVAKNNQRKLVEKNHQEAIIKYCYRKGIKISAFYILGMESDTPSTIKRTIDYAISLNTYLARFSVITPCPGTKFYDQLKDENRLLSDDFKKYSQFKMVFKHDHLSPQQVDVFLERAYRRYYLRLSYWPIFFRYFFNF